MHKRGVHKCDVSSTGAPAALAADAGMPARPPARAPAHPLARSTHKRRQLFWDAYSKLATRATAAAGDGKGACALRYSATAHEVAAGEGTAEIVELTKRQRGLVTGGGVEILGRKLRPPEDLDSKGGWAISWAEEDAAAAYADLFEGEPCIFITPDAVYVGTRFKRALCKKLSAPPKTAKDVVAAVNSLQPDAPLRSVSFAGNHPPVVNAYNTFVAGIAKLDGELPPTIGRVGSASPNDAYAYFLERRNDHLVAEAGKLIARMKVDVDKKLVPLICASSTREAAVAYKMALMKSVYVHESMGKFVDRCRADGAVELHVIRGDVEETEFGCFGKIVFEMFYRVDLTTMGA